MAHTPVHDSSKLGMGGMGGTRGDGGDGGWGMGPVYN